MDEQPTPRWALWNSGTEAWDEVPPEAAPGPWRGSHEYGGFDGDDLDSIRFALDQLPTWFPETAARAAGMRANITTLELEGDHG